ncbi:MAG: hypothetical protein H0X44_07960 [Acidobacteria bacterium]|nr:hypothetical protein [Acidobacteriota bacterium]
MPLTPLSLDTSPEIEYLQVEGWRRMSPDQKAATVSALTAAAIAMAVAGVADRHPRETERMRRYRLAEVLHGPELARKACGHLLEPM